jgi:protein SHQ1
MADVYLAFSPKEQQDLMSLKNKKYLLHDEKSIYLGLVDLMFSYCYDYRTTTGDHTVESGWTLCKLSSSLAAFDTFTSLKEVLVASFRRSLAFPLYRHFDLSLLVLKDTTILFKLGKRALLKALLDMKSVIEKDEICYTVGRLWLEDYCVWLQSARYSFFLQNYVFNENIGTKSLLH